MKWTFSRTQDALDMLGTLPIEGQFALFELIGKLEHDPLPIIEPYGIDDGLTRIATFGHDDQGLIVMLINSDTGMITPVQISWQA